MRSVGTSAVGRAKDMPPNTDDRAGPIHTTDHSSARGAIGFEVAMPRVKF